jgi:hypothetical protein
MYRSNAVTSVRVDYGAGLCAGLRRFPETKAHEPAFKQLNDKLDDAYLARRTARKALIEARAELRFGDYFADQTIRASARAAEIADGGRRGAIFEAIFPDGLTPVVAPKGAKQIAPTQALVDRLTHSGLAGIDAYRSEWLPKLTTSLAELQGASDGVTTANEAYLAAFQKELNLRREHHAAVDQLMGHVRAAFPRDKAKQDLVFPEIEDDEEPAKENGEPKTPEPPKP